MKNQGLDIKDQGKLPKHLEGGAPSFLEGLLTNFNFSNFRGGTQQIKLPKLKHQASLS